MASSMPPLATSARFVLIESINIQGPITCRGEYRQNSCLDDQGRITNICRNRHVRIHHTDRDKDDPQLLGVLAQRPEGGIARKVEKIAS